MKGVKHRKSGLKKSKFWRCVDQCITKSFQRGVSHIGQSVMFLVSPTRSLLCLAQSVQSFQSGNVKANAGVPHQPGRVQYQHVIEFKRGRMVGF